MNLDAIAACFPLPWSHYVSLISRSRSPEAMEFCHAEALRAGSSVRALDRQMSTLLYERSALSRDRAKTLNKLLSSDLVTCEDQGIATNTLQHITSNKDSLGDAYLMASAKHAQEELASFDKAVAGRKDVRVFPLASLMKAGTR